jgi:TonB family protein
MKKIELRSLNHAVIAGLLIAQLTLGQAPPAKAVQESTAGTAQDPSNSKTPPHVVSKSEPEYSEEARHARVNASVTLKLVVRPDGAVDGVRVARAAGFGLDEQAVECVKTWKFAPGMRDGQAVPVQAAVEVNFRLSTKENQGQNARLTFTLPPGAGRPELLKGTIPPNPPPSDPDQRFRIGLTVDSKGKPENLAVIDTTDPKWADQALREMEKWRFEPSSVNGQAAAVDGVLELTAGNSRYPSSKASGSAPVSGNPDTIHNKP